MVPPEVLAQLQPFVTLAQGLGRAATQLVGDSGFTDVYISYTTPRSDDLDTRLLRAMVIKGILESVGPYVSSAAGYLQVSRGALLHAIQPSYINLEKVQRQCQPSFQANLGSIFAIELQAPSVGY